MKKLLFCCAMLILGVTAFANDSVADCHGRKYSAVDSVNRIQYDFVAYTCMRNDTLLEIKLVPTGETAGNWLQLIQDPVWVRQVWKPLSESMMINIVKPK